MPTISGDPLQLLEALERVRPAFQALSSRKLAAAWRKFLEAIPSLGQDQQLAASCSLSPPAFAAGLEAMIATVASPAACELLETRQRAGSGPLVAILPKSPPGLALQVLLPALALRRPVLFKSASAEQTLTPLLLEALGATLPELRPAFAVASWKGGDRAIEDSVFAAAGRVIAYGSGATLADLGARLGTKLVAHGPKISLAIVGRSVDPAAIAPFLARDIALFDQRGCLSIQAIFTAGDPNALADELATALLALAELWPPGPDQPWSQIHQLRNVALMRGCYVGPRSIEAGTIILEDAATPEPSPGGRLVRLYPRELADLPAQLRPWRGLIQGVALAGDDAWALAPALTDLGASHLAAPGALQTPDLATWRNGGLSVLDTLAP